MKSAIFVVVINLTVLSGAGAIAREPTNCAAGAILAYLKSVNEDFSLKEVVQSLPEHARKNESFVSMKDMVFTLARLGHDFESVKYDHVSRVRGRQSQILLLHPPKLNGNGHYVFLVERSRDGFFFIDPANLTKMQFATDHQMETIWHGYALRRTGTPPVMRLLMSVVLILGVVCATCAVLLRRQASHLKAVLVLTVLASCGCQGNSAYPTFDTDRYVLDAIEESKIHSLQVPFRVQGNGELVLEGLNASCACIKISDELVGKTLVAGEQYTLEVEIDPRGKEFISAGILVSLSSGMSKRIAIEGSVASAPQVGSQPILCVHGYGRECTTGEFVVTRRRAEEELPLRPSAFKTAGKHVEIELVKSTVLRNDVYPVAVDKLTWKWTLVADEVQDGAEEIQINWESETNPISGQSTVAFVFRKVPPIGGLIDRVRFGDVKVGDEKKIVLNLVASSNFPSLMTRCTQGLTARIAPSPRNSLCARLEISFKPTELGPFEGEVFLFEDNADFFSISVLGSAF